MNGLVISVLVAKNIIEAPAEEEEDEFGTDNPLEHSFGLSPGKMEQVNGLMTKQAEVNEPRYSAVDYENEKYRSEPDPITLKNAEQRQAQE